jgi:hypothetical protein
MNIFLNSGSVSDPYTVRYFARPIAEIISNILINKVSANNITYLRSILIIIILLLFSLGNNLLFSIAASLVIINAVLDCVDGNIARRNDQASYWGKFIDGFIDNLIYALIPLAGAINLIMRNDSSIYIIVFLILSSVFSLLEQSLMSRLSFYREWIKNKELDITNNNYFNNNPKFFLAKSFFDIHHISALWALFIVSPLYYYIIIASCNTMVSLIRMFKFIFDAYNNINIYKKSSFISTKELNDKKD